MVDFGVLLRYNILYAVTNKRQEIRRRPDMKKFRVIITVIAVIALIAVGFMGARFLDKNKEPKVSATMISEQLTKCSELATARLDYRGLIQYSDGDIPLINQKSFSMVYNAKIKAGVDLGKAKVEVSGKTVKVTLPQAEILDIMVDSESLEFYDEQFAIFNWTNKEDTAKALNYAKEDAEMKAQQAGVLDEADTQAETVVKTLIVPITDSSEYKVEFTRK